MQKVSIKSKSSTKGKKPIKVKVVDDAEAQESDKEDTPKSTFKPSSKYIFEAHLTDSAIFRKLIDSVRDLVDTVTFDLSEEGIHLQALDNNHVSLVNMALHYDGFDNYYCERSISLGINLQSLTKILKCSRPNDKLILQMDSNQEKLNVSFQSSEGKRTSNFNIKLMDIDSEHLTVPEMEYDATILIASGEYQRVIHDLITLGDNVTFEVDEDSFSLSTKGDIGDGKIVLDRTDDENPSDESVHLKIESHVTLTFSMKYLNNFCKATPLSSHVLLSMTKDSPLVTEYTIPNLGYIKYFLAPKIEDE
jgi:proliferating cell nuclear antigen